MAKITIRASGQLNGPYPITKVFEMDNVQARTFMGPNSNEVIIVFLAAHYPGVRFDPTKIGVNVDYTK